jgi:hypothetical protein
MVPDQEYAAAVVTVLSLKSQRNSLLIYSNIPNRYLFVMFFEIVSCLEQNVLIQKNIKKLLLIVISVSRPKSASFSFESGFSGRGAAEA